MSLVVEKGVITAPTTTGNQTYNLGSAFNGILPKALILWTTDQTAADTTNDDSIMCIGFGTYRSSTVAQAYLSLWSQGAGAPTASVVVRGRGTGSILKTFNADAAVVNQEVDLVSFASGTPSNFVLNYADAPSAAVKIHYLVLGGTDITDALVHEITPPSAGTPPDVVQDVTVTASFGQPDFMLWLTGGAFGNADAAGTGYLGLAAAYDETNARNSSYSEADGSANMACALYQVQRAVGLIAGSAVDSFADLSAKASWPTDGYRLLWDDISSAGNRFHGLALKGTFQKALGVNTALTAGSTQDNACGFVPKVGIVWGGNLPADTAIDTADADLGQFGLGATDGTNEGFACITQDDAKGTSFAKRRHNETKTVQNFTPVTPTLESEADGSFSGNNFRLTWGNLDTVAREYVWLALGESGPQNVSLTAATSSESAQALNVDKRVTITPATSTEAAQVLTFSQGAAQDFDLTPALETDAAQALNIDKRVTLAPKTETDAAQALNVDKRKTLIPALETDTAGTTIPLRQLTPATETDSAQTLSYFLGKSITPATSTETAQALSYAKPIHKTLTAAAENDLATVLSFSGPTEVNLTPVLETDLAQALSVTHPIRKSLTPALETDVAVAFPIGSVGIPGPPGSSNRGRTRTVARGRVTSVQSGKIGVE